MVLIVMGPSMSFKSEMLFILTFNLLLKYLPIQVQMCDNGIMKDKIYNKLIFFTRKRHLRDSSPERQKKASKANVSWTKI